MCFSFFAEDDSDWASGDDDYDDDDEDIDEKKKLLDTLAKGQSALKRLDEIFASRNAANARQLPGME